ncbi:MAG: fumarylacetoacetate hydrolase family protein [Nitrospiraceae bacterium]|nr:MAG: fumarylacetoacetate hydrolase family protein [Nitrospiraceae bacterium]
MKPAPAILHMKLFRFGEPDKEKPGIMLPDGRKFDVSSFGEDYDENFFATDGLSRLERWLEESSEELPVIDRAIRLGPPVFRPGKIVCVAFNYLDHARETGKSIPEEPVFFLKAPSALAGPNDNICIPRTSAKTDWEVELAAIMNRKASYVKKEDAMNCVAGFALVNDYSEREFQFNRGGQYVKGKSADTFAPLGPFLVTKDEIKDYKNLKIWLKVNGEIMQNSRTSNMIFDLPAIISSVSRYMSLIPGDIICTGTPAGVGYGMNPPRYLRTGDVVEFGIEGLGEAVQNVVAWGG